jgi:hypothetical protein
VGEEEHFHMKYIYAAFTDWQVWLHIMVYFSIVAPSKSSYYFIGRRLTRELTTDYGITLFLPYVEDVIIQNTPGLIDICFRTIIKTFGYSSAISSLLTVPPYVVASEYCRLSIRP